MSGPSLAGAEAARAFATTLKRKWRKENAADALAALADYPELTRHPSVVVELAYEEYLFLEEAGAAPGPESFAARFPSFRAAVRSVIAAHERLLDEPGLLADGGADWPAPGAVIEGVELVAVLGTGGFGRAYLAYDPNTDRPCVLKLTAGESSEARTMGRLKHPHVIEVYWARAVDGRTAVCMPLVGVNTLAELIGAAFPPDGPAADTADVILATADAADAPAAAALVRAGEPYLIGAAAVAGAVADAVAYLHRQGVTHGDLKPTNVVLGRGGAPFLIDFNLATRGAGPVSVRGTPGYLAPELLDALAANPFATATDLARADLFALGVLVFELLTGRRPFPDADPKSFAAQAVAARTPLPAFPAAVPAAVAALLTACLSADPAARPASAAALADALTQTVTEARTPPAPAPAPVPPPRRWTRRRTAAAVAAVALVTVVGRAAVPVPVPPVVEIRSTLPPTTPEGALAHGQREMERGNWPAAHDHFLKSDNLRPNRWAVALAAYCYSADAKHDKAIEFGGWLDRDKANPAPPDVLTNLAFSLVRRSRSAEGLQVLDRALAADPGNPAARYARSMVRYKTWAPGKAGPLDPVAAADMRAALAAGFDSAEFHFDAARVFAAASDADPTLRAAARAEVRAAVGAGKSPSVFRAEPMQSRFLNGFGSTLAFEAACAVPRGVAPPKPPQLQLVEPRPF